MLNAAKASGRSSGSSTPRKQAGPSAAATTFVEQSWQKASSKDLDHADLEWAAAENEDEENGGVHRILADLQDHRGGPRRADKQLADPGGLRLDGVSRRGRVGCFLIRIGHRAHGQSAKK